MAITFLDEEEDIVAAAEPPKVEGGITFLDEEEPEPATSAPVEAPKITFLDEEPEAPSIGGLAVPPAPEIPKFEATKPSEGVLRQAADLPVQFAIGINNSVKGLSDLFGADNPVSQNLAQNTDWYRGLLSAAAKQDEQEVGRILQEAEGKGILDQLGAGLEAFSVAPADFVASGLGSLAVFAAGGLAGRAAGLGAKGIQAVQAGLGAGMGAGIVKGEIYQSVKDEMLAQGKTEEEAKSVAMEAQSFGGKNLDQILLGAGLGTIDALTGAEKIIGKVLTKGGLKPDASRIGNIIKNGITEAAPEFIQAAQEKFASNLALQREGVNVSLTQGVFSQGALEGLVGLGMGVGAGAIEPRIQTPPTKEEVSAAAAETQDVARRSMDVAPATASLVEGEAEQIVQSQAETPDQRVARLQREAQEAAGIELEEEGAGLPPERIKSARWFESAARNRLKELQDKDDAGVEDFTTQERDEFEFLKANPTPEQIAERYGYGVAPAVEPTAVTTTPPTPPTLTPPPTVTEPIVDLAAQKAELDAEAKRLGADNISSFNSMYVTRDNLTDEQRGLLNRFAEYNKQVQDASWREAAKLDDSDFARWEKSKLITKAVSDQDLTDLGKLHLALKERGDTEKAESVLKNISGSKRNENETIESWREGTGETLTQEEIDKINRDNQEWNDSVDSVLEVVGRISPPTTLTPTTPTLTTPTPTTPTAPAAVEPPPVVPPPVTPEVAARPKVTPEERIAKLDRLKEVKAEIEKIQFKPVEGAEVGLSGLTTEEAKRYSALMMEAEGIRFDLRKELKVEKIEPEKERKSAIPPDIIKTASDELASDRGVWSAITEAAVGTFKNMDTAVDIVMDGKNPDVSPSQLYNAFNNTREALRQKFGDTIKLYRAVGKQKPKATTNWLSTKEAAMDYGKNVVEKEIPIDDIVALNVGLFGRYEEFIIGKKPAAEVAPAIPQLEPLRRVVRAEQTEEDVAGLVDAGFVEVYNGQPVLTQAGIEALPEAERPRLTPEARKIQIDTRTSEAAAEAISKNLRIGVDQVPVDVRMPEGWTLVGDVYVPPQPQELVKEGQPEQAITPPTLKTKYVDSNLERVSLPRASGQPNQARQALEAISKGNSPYAQLAQEIINAANTNPEISFAISNSKFTRSTPEQDRGRFKGRSFYESAYRTISMNPKQAGDTRIAVHEIIHAIISHKLPNKISSTKLKGKKYKKALDEAAADKTLPKPLRDIIRGYVITVEKMGADETLWGSGPDAGVTSQTLNVSAKYLGAPIGAQTKAQREGGRSYRINKKSNVQKLLRYLKENGITEVDVKRGFYGRGGRAHYDVIIANSDLEKIAVEKKQQGKHPSYYGNKGYDPTNNSLTWSIKNKIFPVANDPDAVVEYGFEYGLGNIDEFLSEALSNPEFQKALNEIEMEGGKTVWQTIIDAIARILGIEVKAGSVLDVISRSAFELATEGDLLLAGGRTTTPAPTPEVREARIERDSEVQKAAQDLRAGTINRDEYQRIVDMRMPLRKFETVPTPATNDDMLRGLGERKAGERLKKDLIQNPEAIAEGIVLESRLDIPAYENENVWVVSLHEPRPDINKGNAGQVVAYTPTAVLRNVEFGVTEKAAVGIAAGKPKSTIATMKGEFVPMTAEQAYELANTNKEQWVEIGMNPVRHSYFYDKDTQTPVVSAEEVVQVGGMVLAKNPVFGKREDYLYARRVEMGRAGMEPSAVEARLQELGFPTGGIIRVVNQPDADFEGRTIILDGKVTGIELNASALKDNAAIDRVLNHEFAESANADGALNRLVERLTPKEKKEINDTITRLRYEERARTTEEAARAIEALAEAWNGRGFFTRAVARVEAWASKLGFKLTRRAAEYIAARNLADINSGFRTAYNRFINVRGEDVRLARRDYQADADSYKINDLSKIRKLLNLSNIEDGIVKFLSRDLLDAKWAKIPVANDATTHGHCWVAAEAAYHILGGKGKDWEHRTLNNKGWPEGLDAGETHHFIQNKKTGEIIDPTRSQFGNVTIPYENSIFGGAFMGKTAESPSIRAKALLHRIAVGETRTEVRESRREPEAIPTFTEGTPEAATLKEMATSMAKVDAASEAKGGKPETYKISEIASVWMDSGLGERELQDAIVEYTNLTPANAARVAKAIARQYDIQQSIATAFLETQTGLSVEALPEGVALPKEVDPDRPKPVMQRLFEVFMGVRVPPVKITGNEKTLLKQQIRLKAAANRAAKEAQKETAAAVIETIKQMELRGPVRPKQAQALAKRAANVIWTSEKSVEAFTEYAAKVVENTNYDADVREAKAAQKRAKELSKQKTVAMSPQRQVLEDIGKISIGSIDDPRLFADTVNYYLRAFKKVTSPDYVVIPDSEMTSYLSQLENQEIDTNAERERVSNEKLAAQYGLPVSQVEALLNSQDIIRDLVAYAKREQIESILNQKIGDIQTALKAYDQTQLRPDQRKLVDSLLAIDAKGLDAKEKQSLIRIGNNVIYNNQTNGAQYFVAVANGQQNARQAAQDFKTIEKNRAWIDLIPTLGSKRVAETMRNWSLELQSVADTFRNIFGKESMAKIFRQMGMYNLDRGFTDAANTLDQIQEKMAEFYKKNTQKYKKAARDQNGILSEGVVGFLIQQVPAKGEAESIAQRRDLIKQDIANRRSSRQADKIEMANRIEEILGKVDGNTVEEILANMKANYRPNYDSLTYLMNDLLPQYKDFLKQFDENFNDQANNYDNPYYLPIAFIRSGPELEITPESESMFYEGMSLRPRQAANTIKRVDYNVLPKDKSGNPKEIQFNLRRGTYDSLSDQINKAYTNEAWQQIFSFMKTADADAVFGGRANKDFMAERLNRLRISRMRRGSANNGAISKFADSISVLARKIGTGIALGGVFQVFKQSPDQLISAIGTTGRYDLLGEHVMTIGSAKKLLDKFSIGRRGDASSGYKYINQMEGAQNRLERAFTESRWSEVKENASKVADVWMLALKKTDFLCAASAWMTYYRANLDKNGIKFEGWDKEAQLVDTDPSRQDAASYAEQMTDIYQGSSDPTKMATFAQSGKSGWENFVKAALVPFNSFAVQQRMRIYSDGRDSFTKAGETGALGRFGLASTIGGLVAFHTMRRLVLPTITGLGVYALYGMLGVDMDEPDDEKKKEQARKTWRQFQGELLANTLVGGAPQFVEAATIDAFNYANYLVSLQLESEDIIDDNGEIMDFAKYQKERSPFWRYQSFKNAPSFGMFDVGFGQAEKVAVQTKQLMDREQMEMYTPEEQRLLYFSTLSEWLYLMRLNDADFARMVGKARRDMIKAVEDREKQIKAIREGR